MNIFLGILCSVEEYRCCSSGSAPSGAESGAVFESAPEDEAKEASKQLEKNSAHKVWMKQQKKIIPRNETNWFHWNQVRSFCCPSKQRLSGFKPWLLISYAVLIFYILFSILTTSASTTDDMICKTSHSRPTSLQADFRPFADGWVFFCASDAGCLAFEIVLWTR